MGKAGKISIIAGVIVIFIVLIYFFGIREGDDDTYITDNWSETFAPEDKGPYGTYMLKELLDTAGLFGNFIDIDNELEDELLDNPKLNDIYFFVGSVNFMADSSAEFLLDFVEQGNTAFIAARSFPYVLLKDYVFDPEYPFTTTSPRDSVQYLKFIHPDLAAKRYSFKYVYNNRTSNKTWNYFDTTAFFSEYEKFKMLGTNTKGEVNFVKIKCGKGWVYLHSIPYCFTNISMMKRDGFQYAEHTLEHIPHGRVQWDRYNLYSHSDDSSGDDDSGGGEERRSMLEFVLKHPPLVWAMVILLLGAVLYAMFKGKRMQMVIPATELKENTSMKYVNTLSSLYMQQGSHSKLISLKEKTFLNFIAERYYIHTQKADDKFIEKVAVKSKVNPAFIKEIFDLFHQLEGVTQVTDDQLILLHQKIEYFYKNCK